MSKLFGGFSTDTSCKHPLKAWTVGINEDTGKRQIVVTGYDELNYLRYDGKIITDFQLIPCGKCISCRLKSSKQWADRMMLEAREHESNYFLTLTYNDLYLPESNYMFDLDTGEILYDEFGKELQSPIHPLVLSDVQKFLKRLRKRFPDQTIRYYLAGEYGSLNYRPHYHLILFGLKLPEDDLFIPKGRCSKNELGQQYYNSKTIEELWCYVDENKNLIEPFYRDENGDYDRDKIRGSLGFHIITSVNWQTCAYVARYCQKKKYGDESYIYDQLNYPREFATMSRKPGIGYNYYKDHKDEIYDTDEVFIGLGVQGGKKVKPPSYYDRLYDIDEPERMNIIRLRRNDLADVNKKLREKATSLCYEDQLSVEEHALRQRTKVYKRERSF